jgi:NADPH:quinone reductase-like Zn-dependent oxidoreductase
VSNIRKATHGVGVDVILNSMAGELLHEGWDCVADFGRFLEIIKEDLVDSRKLDMETLF